MTAKLSVEEVLATLEARTVFHREQEAFHAEREVHHREQRALHRGQLRKPIGTRAASNLLRRMHAEGRITLVRPGKAFAESLYRHGGS